MQYVTRFAPSPTGPLHLGHAYSAILAHDMAMANGGRFLLRIEDIDRERSKPEWEAQIYDDLAWLGLTWETPVMRQSDRLPAYRQALEALWQRDLLYPCTCTRRDILDSASAPQEGEVQYGPDGIIYPGTCRHQTGMPHSLTPMPDNVALRLDMDLTAIQIGENRIGEGEFVYFRETGHGPNGETGLIEFRPEDLLTTVGDIVLSRKTFLGSYHMSVVLDDAAQGVTHVVRGQDLFEATHIHVALQRLLKLPTPEYHHHALIRDENGKRLAKRDDAKAIRKFREEGASPTDIREMVGLPLC
ncbi:tRNA glutamyl-Q(34) synthetase GluQRS [Marivivens aquimaris]|uniref:tRNA glutamyl-Q(34) synthetase GluQRS n=1 Tax=Marivivens aquimaris TaxID=2774876 RepID=UPI00188161AF|nr:tRNA glutamyl-Q(34) synthetase GluQRS [Marivivens aquimaris]